MKCATCGQELGEWPPDISFRRPDEVWVMSLSGYGDRVREGDELCLIDGVRHFLRGVLHLPLAGRQDTLGLGLWVEVAAADFERYALCVAGADGQLAPRFPGRIANALAPFPDALGAEVEVQTGAPEARPTLHFSPGSELGLARVQASGLDEMALIAIMQAFGQGWACTCTKATSRPAYWHWVEPVWDTISIYDGAEVFLEGFATAADPSRTLFAAHWCQSEVRNGGFEQFFANSTGVLAPEAVTAFTRLGLVEAAAAVSEAMARLGDPYPREQTAREEAMDRLYASLDDDDDAYSAFDDLDGRFYAEVGTDAARFRAAADAFAASVVCVPH